MLVLVVVYCIKKGILAFYPYFFKKKLAICHCFEII